MIKSILAFLGLLLITAHAFVVVVPPAWSARMIARAMSSEPAAEEGEEGGLDLDLGEMFSMFDAADKGEDFDKAMSKVKTEDK